jgi:hypothetical protein
MWCTVDDMASGHMCSHAAYSRADRVTAMSAVNRDHIVREPEMGLPISR